MICIPLKTWLSWTAQEQSQVQQYYESNGTKWYVDSCKPVDYAKDKEEYQEDMSLGGRSYPDQDE